MDDLGGLWGVGVVQSVLYQATLTTIQMLHTLLTNHDFLVGEMVHILYTVIMALVQNWYSCWYLNQISKHFISNHTESLGC